MYSSSRSSLACVGFRGYAGGFAAIAVMEDRDRASTGVEGDDISAMKDSENHHYGVGLDSIQVVDCCGMVGDVFC